MNRSLIRAVERIPHLTAIPETLVPRAFALSFLATLVHPGRGHARWPLVRYFCPADQSVIRANS
jgi:hypothetical protein